MTSLHTSYSFDFIEPLDTLRFGAEISPFLRLQYPNGISLQPHVHSFIQKSDSCILTFVKLGCFILLDCAKRNIRNCKYRLWSPEFISNITCVFMLYWNKGQWQSLIVNICEYEMKWRVTSTISRESAIYNKVSPSQLWRMSRNSEFRILIITNRSVHVIKCVKGRGEK
jgi:hypothetical protein